MQEEIKKAADTLRKGGTILYPTDTIWGIGCDATNCEAVKKVFTIKGREETKSLLMLVDSLDRVYRYVENVPDIACELIEASDVPLTIIYSCAVDLAGNLINEDGSIGIRITRDPFCRELIRRFGKPIVSTSANQSDCPHPGNFSEISSDIISSVDYVVNHRQTEKTKFNPSPIIKLGPKGEIKIIRN